MEQSQSEANYEANYEQLKKKQHVQWQGAEGTQIQHEQSDPQRNPSISQDPVTSHNEIHRRRIPGSHLGG